MKILNHKQIEALGISPKTCFEWIKESFSLKEKAQLPAKISLHPQGNDFFNSMPCVLPSPSDYFGIKVVHRIKGATPALGGDILLYNSRTGELLALLDSDWITTMRTGAVAVLAIQTLRQSQAKVYGFVGLGNTARSTMLSLLENEPDVRHKVLLFRYKNQAELFVERFSAYDNVEFTIVDDMKTLVSVSDVIVSCVTEVDGLLCEDDTCFKEGCLVVPVHTRGFQNCDLFFDKVFADDTDHVRDFRYFNRFKKYAELQDVLSGKNAGRENDSERILSYNIGLAIHDVVFASKIYESLKDSDTADFEMQRNTDKFWI